MPAARVPGAQSPPPRRIPWSLVAALVAFVLLATPTPAGASPPSPGDERPTVSAPTVHRVTLLTGDTVTVTELGDGRSTVSVAPDDRVGSGAIRTTTIGDHLYVVPAAAMPYVASGAFDRALFDVTGLLDQGLADGDRRTLPLIVQYRDARYDGAAADALTPEGAVLTRDLTSISATAVNARKADTTQFWRDVTGRSPAAAPTQSADPALRDGIVKVWLDGRVEAQLAESVAQIGAPDAWAAGYDGTGATVAVLDTGIDATHPDLVGQIQTTRSFVPGETVTDGHGHGTHVASTVLGTGAASEGVEKGVAPGARLLVGKVLGDDGFGQDSWIIDGMEWAASNADVVSMSLGSLEPSDGSDPMAQALDALSDQTGTLFVVAAGNLGMDQGVTSPGVADAALTVGAVDATDSLAWFSSRGPRLGDMALKPDLVAPGVDISAARSQFAPGEGFYQTMSGTSMAAPHVAGAAAILAQRHPGWDATRLKDALMSTTKVLDGTTPYQVGSGRVDVPAAVLGDVTATGSAFFGFDQWPPSDTAPITRTVTYHNDADTPAALDLAVDLRDSAGDPVPDGLVAVDDTDVTVPAHGTTAVTVTLDPALATNGQQYTGRLTATAAGEAVVHTTLGYAREDERYDLTINAVDRAGEPALAWVDLVGGPVGYDPLVVDGTLTVRRAPGTYSVATWLDVDTGTDHVGTALLMQPEVVLDRDRTVTLDAREAVPVTATVPRSPVEASQRRMSWFRQLDPELPIGSDLMIPVLTDDLYATPTPEVTKGAFDFTTRWRLHEPLMTLEADGEPFDVTVQPGSSLSEDEATLPVVVEGSGSDGVDLTGKALVVEHNDAVATYDRAVAAREAGAALLLVVNDDPTELNEWVGGPNGEATGIPVAAISGAEGARFFSANPPTSLHLVARPDSAWVYDLQDPHPGSIPSDLAYEPDPDQLARVTGEYASDRSAPGAEFRYDFRPESAFGVGFMEWLSLPRVREEWVSAEPGTTWYQEAAVLDPFWDVRGVRAALHPGEHTTSRWFSPVVRPRLGEGYWGPTRSGSFMSINLPSFADSGAGHTGDMYGTAEQRIWLYDGRGKLLKAVNDQAIWINAHSAARMRYHLVTTAERDPRRWRTSPSTRTAWRFWSQGGAR